ncbi:MAG: DUF2065 family protein [Candidatus Omnitrophica bacterium]|nr:DUF2065 family protein [Candidatus Omnitrophota bacterium]
MVILARALGVVIVAMGTLIAINPLAFKGMINFWKKGKNIYIAGALRLFFGTLFIFVSSRCRFPLAISILGVLMIIGGIAIFLIGPERIRTMFAWWEQRPPLLMRLMGLIALVVGALVIYSI